MFPRFHHLGVSPSSLWGTGPSNLGSHTTGNIPKDSCMMA
jgi:hypothetical protein